MNVPPWMKKHSQMPVTRHWSATQQADGGVVVVGLAHGLGEHDPAPKGTPPLVWHCAGVVFT
jgi:hypothetical protein